MDHSQPNPCKNVIITDIEKTITSKMVFMFLKEVKLSDRVKSYQAKNSRKVETQICIEFAKAEHASQFIEEHNHRSQILLRKFNISLDCFQGDNLRRFEVTGVSNDRLRQMYDCCKQYGPCRFRLNYQDNKLAHSCFIEFSHFQDHLHFQPLREALALLELKIRQEETFGDFNKFRCSIELTNFDSIKDVTLNREEAQELTRRLEQLVGEVTSQPLLGVELCPFMHGEQPAIKAFFGFSSVDLTMSEFQKLRKWALDKAEQVRCRLFFFQDEANSYRTLFMKGIINPKQLSVKWLEQEMLQAFRKISPKVVQIMLKQAGGRYTAKIYLSDEDGGRELVVDVGQKRSLIYQFFKMNGTMGIDVFQNGREQRKHNKLQMNASKMMTHLQHPKEGPFGLPLPLPPPRIPPPFKLPLPPPPRIPPPFGLPLPPPPRILPPYKTLPQPVQHSHPYQPQQQGGHPKKKMYREKEEKTPNQQRQQFKLREDDFPPAQ